MRRSLLGILLLLMTCVVFEACKDRETYADQLEAEKKAIKQLIKDSAFKVITQEEFFKQDTMTRGEKEYVQLSSGVYMNIVDKGSDDPADTVRNNDFVLVRFEEYRIKKDSFFLTCTNLNTPYVVDQFRYTNINGQMGGILTSGSLYSVYTSTSIPAGWLAALNYVRDGAHVKLIVPSKMGHQTAVQYVYPFFYDIRKFQFYR